MRFVVLGSDRAVLPLVQGLAAHPDHTLTHAALAEELQGELMRLVPAIQVTNAWDELLAGDDFDAAIVAGHSADVLLAARQLAQSGTALVVLPDVRQGAEWVYELTLIRDDTRVRLVPVFPRRFESGIQQFADALRSPEAGRLLHIEMEHECEATATTGTVPLLTTAQIDAALLHDVDLLRSLGGDYSQVTAFHSGRTVNGVSTATVSLAGENLPEASWSLKAAPHNRWRIAATTERGTASLAWNEHDPDGAAPRRTEFHSVLAPGGRSGTPSHISEPPPRPQADASMPSVATRLRAHVEQALAGAKIAPDWTDLTRAFETVEAARRSVARRRTIDLHFETASERSQFKTHMTALGCGLLSATLAGVVVLLLLGALFRGGRDEQELRRLLEAGWTIERIAADPDRLPGYDADELRRMLDGIERGENVMRIARIVVFLPLAAFLLFQLLVFVARPSAAQQKTRTSSPA